MNSLGFSNLIQKNIWELSFLSSFLLRDNFINWMIFFNAIKQRHWWRKVVYCLSKSGWDCETYIVMVLALVYYDKGCLKEKKTLLNYITAPNQIPMSITCMNLYIRNKSHLFIYIYIYICRSVWAARMMQPMKLQKKNEIQVWHRYIWLKKKNTHTHTFLQIGHVLIFLVLPNKEPNLVPFFVATGCLQQFLKI